MKDYRSEGGSRFRKPYCAAGTGKNLCTKSKGHKGAHSKNTKHTMGWW